MSTPNEPLPRVLVVEDHAPSRTALAALAEQQGFSVSVSPSLRGGLDAIQRTPPDVLLADVHLPDGSGVQFLRTNMPARIPIGLITGDRDVSLAIEALQQGAAEYFLKPLPVAKVNRFLRRVSDHVSDRNSIPPALQTLVGRSPGMQHLMRRIRAVAPSQEPVLIVGETGTGKELVARSIHQLSTRREHDFLAVNCGAMPSSLIDSEFFGHEKGSFTGAAARHRGVFEQASGGTLFLDEITEMPIEQQVKLLRVLETGAYRRVGSEQELSCNVRVVSATNRRCEQAIADGMLRKDVFYRLGVVIIEIPPLRARGDDVQLLADHILAQVDQQYDTVTKLDVSARERLATYSWPGNVRELRNVLRAAHLVTPGNQRKQISRTDITFSDSTTDSRPVCEFRVGESLEQLQERAILSTLEAFTGDKARAARELGISLKTLYTKLHAIPNGQRWLRARKT